ncbi:MAG TPA: cation diffusion facilitator family transporter, partial [Armatimonadota bacterium]
SILSNSFLILLKVVVGSLSGSVSIVADALHSGADLLAALVAFFTVRQSHKPPDQDHPYGHGKFENVSGVVEALLILPASGWIAVEAIQKLRHGGELSHVYLGIGLMAFSAVLNWGVSSKLHRVARETESPALEADAVHLQTDIYSSLAVVFGLGLVRLTGVQAMDPLLALVVATMMVKMAWDLMKPSVEVLVDRGLPEEEVRRVEEVLRRDERILGFHQLRTRRSGGTRLVDVHVQLDDDLSLRAAHRVTEEVEDEIRRELPNTQVMVHTEPYREELRHQEEYHGRSGSF